MDLKTKKEMVRKLTQRYQRTIKTARGKSLKELIGLTGYERS